MKTDLPRGGNMKKVLLALALASCAPGALLAHCDSLDGPVVTAAKAALESGNAGPVLAWVQKDDEAAVKAAFLKAREARKAGGAAAEVADLWFFETLVRVHRAGEGAPYTGLRPAGSAEEIVKELDASIEKGDIRELSQKMGGHVERAIGEKFSALLPLKKEADKSVEKGRAYVGVYVEFMHYVEGIVKAVHGGAHHAAAKDGHEGEAEEKPVHVH